MLSIVERFSNFITPSGYTVTILISQTSSVAVGTADRAWLSVLPTRTADSLLPTEGFTFFLLCDIIYLSATDTGGIYGEAA